MNAKQAAVFARLAHHGQKRRDGGDYFMDHVFPVARAVNADTPAPPALVENRTIVALLHDVLEDTPVTRWDLRVMGLNSVLLEAVDAITKRHGEKYREYIQRVAANPLARFVKIRDIRHNLNDDPTELQTRRYRWALGFLGGKDG